MIVKILIGVLIWNSNFSDGFPLENFSIDSNRTDSHELINTKGDNDSQIRTVFELIHQNNEDRKILKKRNTNEQDNSAENHIHHKDNLGHHSNGFSYQRPTNVFKESAESHRNPATEIHTKNTKTDTENIGENSTTKDNESKESLTTIEDQEEWSITASHQTSFNHSKTHQQTSSSSVKSHTETGHRTDFHDSTTAMTISSKTVETTDQSKEPNPVCDDSVEDVNEMLTKNSSNSSKSSNKFTKSVKLTTKIEESKENDVVNHQSSGNHSKTAKTSEHSNLSTTNFLKSSTKSHLKTTKVHNVTKSSINQVLHHSTNHIEATRHDSTLSAVNSTEKFADLSKTPHDTQATHKNTKNSHQNSKSSSSLDSNHTTSHNLNHNSITKHRNSQRSTTSLPYTRNLSNHKIIHSQDTTHFDEWIIANKEGKIESQEDNKLGSKYNHKKSTTHHDAFNIKSTLKPQHLTSTSHHESNNHFLNKTDLTTDHDMQKIRFAIPRAVQKQNQGMKNEEDFKFDHNHLDDVEVFKVTEKSITVAAKRQTDKHVIKFVG